jgi:VCBS repeat-containing protein
MFSLGDGSADTSMTFAGTVAAVNSALNGLMFEPIADFTGAASLQIIVTDTEGGSLSDTETVSIAVVPVNDAPVSSVPANQSTNEDTTLVLSSANANQVTISDQDAGTAPVLITVSSTNSTITLAGTSGLTFFAGDGTADISMMFEGTITDINAALNGLAIKFASNFYGLASLTIVANDQGNAGAGSALTASGSIIISVIEQNDAPSSTDDSAVTTEDTPVTANVLANDTDPDNTDGIPGNEDTLTSVLDAGPDHGTLLLNTDGSFVYVPDADFFGSDTFSYHVVNGDGTSGEAATVTISVGGTNDSPVALDESYEVSNDDTLGASLLDGVADPDGDVLTVSLLSGPANGTLTIKPDGSFRYTPNAQFIGSDSFTYVITDGQASTTATVTLHVAASITIPLVIPPTFPPPPSTESESELMIRRPPVPVTAVVSVAPTTVAELQHSSPSTRVGHLPARNHSNQVQGIDSVPTELAHTNAADAATAGATASHETHVGRNLTHQGRRGVRRGDSDPLTFSFDTSTLWGSLDSLRDQLAGDLRYQVLTAGTATAVTTAFTAGYLLWTLRGGYLLATVLSSIPAWRMMDPLPILDSQDSTKDKKGDCDQDDEDNDTLASWVARSSAPNETTVQDQMKQ